MNHQSTSAANMTFNWVSLALTVLIVVALWQVFSKAGRPGWAAIIPFYNGYVLLKIAGRPGWWLVLLLIPLVNIVIWLVVSLDMAKAFGRSGAFGVFGLWLFAFIGYPILGFGSARYLGRPDGAPAA